MLGLGFKGYSDHEIRVLSPTSGALMVSNELNDPTCGIHIAQRTQVHSY